MLIKSEYRPFKRLPQMALAALTLAVLSACGDGPMEGKTPLVVAPANPAGVSTSTDPAATPSTPSSTNDALQNASSNAANATSDAARLAAQAEMTRLAIQQGLEQQEGATGNTGKKMLVVGLDNASRVADNSSWLDSERFASMTDQQKADAKETYVSLAGADLQAWFEQSCPSISDPADQEMYRCAAGIYFGKNADGNMCFTTIGWNGHVQHVNEGVIVPFFVPGDAAGAPMVNTQFTKASAGGNTVLYINAAATSANVPDAKYEVDENAPYRSKQMVFTYNSGANSLTILQKDNAGTLNSTCTINMTGIGG